MAIREFSGSDAKVTRRNMINEQVGGIYEYILRCCLPEGTLPTGLGQVVHFGIVSLAKAPMLQSLLLCGLGRASVSIISIQGGIQIST
jgi:hypothetical protein